VKFRQHYANFGNYSVVIESETQIENLAFDQASSLLQLRFHGEMGYQHIALSPTHLLLCQ
jgi:hypothetical protein